jgi:hypothetical protein
MKHHVIPAITPVTSSSSTSGSSLDHLPQEVQSMILEHVIEGPACVPLYTPAMHHSYRLHAKPCCGSCRAIEIVSDRDCRCNGLHGNSSSGCRCLSLSDGVFQVSKGLRSGVLRLYWSTNTFMAHGAMALPIYDLWDAQPNKQTPSHVEHQSANRKKSEGVLFTHSKPNCKGCSTTD